MSNRWFGLAVIAAMLVFALAVFPRLPETIPTHWNFAGEADGWSPRFPSAFFMPGTALAIWLLALVLPRIDPRRERYPAFAETYWLLIGLTLLFLAGMQVVVLGVALGWPLDVGRVVPAGTGLLFIGIGNVLPRVRSNWWMGIRTPWTLSSERVWQRTHRVGGRVFVAAGLLFVLVAVFPVGEWVIPAIIFGAVLGTTAYSYFAWRREQRDAPPSQGS
jgi:uncharacterized membrane protein